MQDTMLIPPWDQDNPSQTACLAGTYNPNTGSTSPSACGDADAGYYVPTTGQSTQLAADAGYYVHQPVNQLKLLVL